MVIQSTAGVLILANTIKKRRKKTLPKKKRKPVKKRPTLIPAVLFLLLTASLIGVLYLIAGKHLTRQIPSTRQKTPSAIQPQSSNHQEPDLRRKNQRRPAPTTPPPAAAQTSKLTIYRLSADFTQLVAAAATVDNNFTDKQKAQHIISLLTRSAKGDQAPLSSATRLRSVSFKEQLITIDLSADIHKNLVNSGANDEIMTVTCLSNSLLKNFPRYNSVQILIDGKKCRTLAGHIDISRPLSYQTGIAVKTD